MTGPIKPSGSPGVAPSVPDARPLGDIPRAEFREALEAGAPSAGDRAGEVSTELARLVDEVKAGRLDAADAVEALVARALSSSMARGLAPAARAGLEAHLRAALAEDPVLGQMVADLERAR